MDGFFSWKTPVNPWDDLGGKPHYFQKHPYGGFLKWWYPTTMGFLLKMIIWGVLGVPPFKETSICSSVSRHSWIFGSRILPLEGQAQVGPPPLRHPTNSPSFPAGWLHCWKRRVFCWSNLTKILSEYNQHDQQWTMEPWSAPPKNGLK